MKPTMLVIGLSLTVIAMLSMTVDMPADSQQLDAQAMKALVGGACYVTGTSSACVDQSYTCDPDNWVPGTYQQDRGRLYCKTAQWPQPGKTLCWENSNNRIECFRRHFNQGNSCNYTDDHTIGNGISFGGSNCTGS